jgi:hypothetical protein
MDRKTIPVPAIASAGFFMKGRKMTQRFLNAREASDYLFENYGTPVSQKPKTLQNWATLKKGPKTLKLANGSQAWTPAALDAYAQSLIGESEAAA